jgi:hypothetical protein
MRSLRHLHKNHHTGWALAGLDRDRRRTSASGVSSIEFQTSNLSWRSWQLLSVEVPGGAGLLGYSLVYVLQTMPCCCLYEVGLQ